MACGINLLECMLKHGAKRLVFSSSASVYGEPKEVPITEAAPVSPVNAYGQSKLMFEPQVGRHSENSDNLHH